MENDRDCMKSTGILLFGIGVLLIGVAMLIGIIRGPRGWSTVWTSEPQQWQTQLPLFPPLGGAVTNRQFSAISKQQLEQLDSIKAKMKKMGFPDEQIDKMISMITNSPPYLKQETITYKPIK